MKVRGKSKLFIFSAAFHESVYVCAYIYIWACVCVCVCVFVNEKISFLFILLYSQTKFVMFYFKLYVCAFVVVVVAQHCDWQFSELVPTALEASLSENYN